jgi:phosphatidylserine decarboxylase
MFILFFLPKNLLSFLFGWFATIQVPIFSALFRDVFCRLFDLDETEMHKPIKAYPTLQKLFTRTIKSEARVIADTEMVSPVDGKVSQTGSLTEGQLIQAKGKNYDLAGLLGNAELASTFEGGKWATVYLAPFNYHRIHSPVNGIVKEAIYVSGNLWPVNEWSVGTIDNLFSVNERLTSLIEHPDGNLLVVKVGAYNVGRITIDYSDHFIANKYGKKGNGEPLTYTPAEKVEVTKGGGLGCFELGSTVVLIADKNFISKHPEAFKTQQGEVVRMGQAF